MSTTILLKAAKALGMDDKAMPVGTLLVVGPKRNVRKGKYVGWDRKRMGHNHHMVEFEGGGVEVIKLHDPSVQWDVIGPDGLSLAEAAAAGGAGAAGPEPEPMPYERFGAGSRSGMVWDGTGSVDPPPPRPLPHERREEAAELVRTATAEETEGAALARVDSEAFRREYMAQVRKTSSWPKLAQKLGQLQPFTAVFPQERVGQLASFGPT